MTDVFVQSSAPVPPPPISSKPRLQPAGLSSPARLNWLIRVVVALVGILLLAILGFALGSRLGKSASTTAPVAPVTQTPTAQTEGSTPDPQTTTESSGPLSNVTSQDKLLHAGIQANGFKPYSLSLGQGWAESHSSDLIAATDTLTLSKDAYSIVISQAGMSAGACSFPGSPAQDNAQSFSTFTGIPGVMHQYRRGTNDNTTYTICEKKGDGYVFPTSFGSITYTTPNPADTAVLNAMDAMVASLND